MFGATALFASGLIGKATREVCMGLGIDSGGSKQHSKNTYNYNSNFTTRTPKVIVNGKPYKINN